MWSDIIKGFIIGMCASAPLGPIAILVLQKSLSEGHRAGFLTGLGACLVDSFFAIIAMFALASTKALIEENKSIILFVGAIVMIGMGLKMSIGNPFKEVEKRKSKKYSSKDFFQAILMGISNPGAIAVIFALFSSFNIDLDRNGFNVAPIILSLAAGAAIYWFLFSWLFSHFRTKFRLNTIIWVNRALGIVLIIIGLALLAEFAIKLIFN